MPTNYKQPRKFVYKRDSIMFFSSPGKKKKALKHASKILKDKANWCKECKIEK